MKTKTGMMLAGVLGLILLAGVARAQSVPQLINYQGRLTEVAGLPVVDGTTVDMTFGFYGAPSAGAPYLVVLQDDVVVNNGIYNVLIGSGALVRAPSSRSAALWPIR
ncbi:MAG: hypothetical protein MZU91_06930 [Desulfosudis oleivorans]|nr:hypothetical protein [Desulfosudis oleivorans]